MFMRGKDVKDIQQRLNEVINEPWGYKLIPDGIYGYITMGIHNKHPEIKFDNKLRQLESRIRRFIVVD